MVDCRGGGHGFGISSIFHHTSTWIYPTVTTIKQRKQNPQTWNVVENMILNEIVRVVSCFPRYISFHGKSISFGPVYTFSACLECAAALILCMIVPAYWPGKQEEKYCKKGSQMTARYL